MSTTVELSRINPDFNAIVQQLNAELSTRPVWKDGFLQTSTGRAITEHIAGVAALDQYAIASALEEATLTEAKNDSSVYAWTIGQGVRIPRKLPARCSVNFTFTTALVNQETISAYTQFRSQSGVSFFNRSSIVIPVGSTSFVVDLYEGLVVRKSVVATGADYQIFVTPEANFGVSDQDFSVRINNNQIDVVTSRFWERKGVTKSAVWDRTLKTGQAMLMFGNDIYGAKPLANDTVDFLYVVCSGQQANTTGLVGSELSGYSNNGCKTIIATSVVAGADEPNAYTLKKTAPILWGTYESAVTKTQYQTLPIQYPGIVDIATFAQRELSTWDLRWMNLVKIVLLTSTTWTATDLATFEAWYQARSIYSTRFFFEQPIQNVANIVADVHCDNTADLPVVRLKCQVALQNLFEARYRILSASFYKSDIIDAIYAADQSVNFVRLHSPSTDMYAGVAAPSSILLFADPVVGTLIAGTAYNYVVTATNAQGETSAKAVKQLVLPVGSTSVKLIWNGQPGATTYKIYGRTGNTFDYLTTVPGTQNDWIDTGATAPIANTKYPSIDTTGVHYWSLGAVDLIMNYTSRVIRNVQ